MEIMNLKWTKADAKRAAQMGWFLDGNGVQTYSRIYGPKHLLAKSPFKSDREAAEWVWHESFTAAEKDYRSTSTCYKTIILCLIGGEK